MIDYGVYSWIVFKPFVYPHGTKQHVAGNERSQVKRKLVVHESLICNRCVATECQRYDRSSRFLIADRSSAVVLFSSQHLIV